MDDVLALFLRAEGLLQRGDRAAAREGFATLVQQRPDHTAARLQLGMLLDEVTDYAAAREQYAALLKVQPNNVVALNNLAYSLAVHQQNPGEALPLARRAYALAPGDVRIVDTLSWIHHLDGNSVEAARLLRDVVQRETGNVEVHLHAAIVFGAVGDFRAAERQLAMALRYDPKLEETSEVKALRQRLAGKGAS
jgi:Flp pilus assembly protein TadD